MNDDEFDEFRLDALPHGMPRRIRKIFDVYQIETFGDVRKLGIRGLLSLKGFGRVALKQTQWTLTSIPVEIPLGRGRVELNHEPAH